MPNALGLLFSAFPSNRGGLGRRRPSRAVVVGGVYFVLHLVAHLSARWFEIAPGVSLWYPPAGLALAVLVLAGPRLAPVVFAANLAGAWLTQDLGLNWSVLLLPWLITANYTAAAVIARHWLGPRLLPGSVRDTVIFIAGTILAPAGIAVSGTLVVAWTEPLSAEALLRTAAQWWLGDANGLLTVVPAVMVFAGPWARGEQPLRFALPRQPHRLLLPAAQVIALVGSLWLVFATDALPRPQTLYLCFLPLVWICLRHGLPGATVATLLITMGGLIGLRLTDGSMQTAIGFLLFELTVAVVGLGLGSTVTRRNAAEQRLVADEALLDRVIAGAQIGVWDWNLDTDLVVFNRRCAELLGHDTAGLAAPSSIWRGHIHPSDADRAAVAVQAHLAGASPLIEVEYRLRSFSGVEHWIHTRGSVVARDDRGRPLIVSGTHVDVTDRRRAEAEAGRRLEIIEATPDFVLTTDTAGHVLHANAALLRFWAGGPAAPWRGRPVREQLDAETSEALAAIMANLPGAGLWTGEIHFGNAAGVAIPVSLVALLHHAETGAADSFSFVLRDISRRKQTEAARLEQERRLLQLQKTESLGVLAGGIAHDFNNLLMAMLGNAELARCDLPADSPVHESLGQIEAAAQRAADLCQQMLAYAGRRPLSASDVDLNHLIEQTQRLFHASIGRKIAVQLALAPTPVVVRATPPQLQQVVLNLVVNAAQAIGDRPGRISLRTATRDFARDELRAHFGVETLAEGRYALCEVEDTGGGIPPEVRRRIFEPFFTTKPSGHGLGLAAAHGVVTAHQGAITVDSKPGQGTTFRFILPLASTVAVAAQPPTLSPGWHGAGTVLVADDEPSVRQIAAQMLASFGFATVIASDGAEAVALFRQHAGTIRLALLDVVMPGMDGLETLQELRRLEPALPVVLMSGYTGKLMADPLDAQPPAALLAKPFTREALQSRLAAVLAHP